MINQLIEVMVTMMFLNMSIRPVMLQIQGVKAQLGSSSLEASHYVQNLEIHRCPKCGHQWYASGKWNMPRRQEFFSKVVYCTGCHTYFKVTVKEATKDDAQAMGYSIA